MPENHHTQKNHPKKTAIVCISDIYLARGLQLRDFYEKQGDEVRIYTPDFSHRRKALIEKSERIAGVYYLPHMPYQKNLSVQRLYGHYAFAKESRKAIEDWQANRIHALVPANSIAGQMARYKADYPDTELYFDLIDLWPESLPIGWFMKTPPAWIWRSMRNRHLGAADLLFAECGLFAETIEEQTGLQPDILYWSLEDDAPVMEASLPRDHMALCYLGSVNNIIDLDWMEAFLEELSGRLPVSLHVIASGEKKQEMLERFGRHVQIIDYGHVYDPRAKQEIFAKCHYGLNLMKESVMIGLSMKSLDYLKGGLPMINSLGGDLQTWIEEKKTGINVDRDDIKKSVDTLLAIGKKEHLQMRANARDLYEKELSMQAFEKQLEQSILSLKEPDDLK